MAFPYVFGRSTGKVGYRTRTVHHPYHGGESAYWGYEDLRWLVKNPEQFRACGTCKPSMEMILHCAKETLDARFDRDPNPPQQREY